jgi:hypothetical protein
MGTLCQCSDSNEENFNEFYGFNTPRKYLDDNKIKKKQCNNYNEKDKIFYEKTVEYDKFIKKRLNNDRPNNNEPKEYINGTVKVIRI